ncbi:hypothetical protein CFC21_015472 [Triticum aestivum]|uniref:Uncharacterized protein n=3 Tax=Triticum TaxID=4564 RepID=A0A9R1R364_TRITD|nr:hypothetical protein CFC21_015472 [Triticum aestivum]VAH26590.1 unnamed protein product [Triticum turgidum subsp. durum]
MDITKATKLGRLKKFHSDHLDMFLPPDIDIHREEFVSTSCSIFNVVAPSSTSHINGDDDPHFWVESSGRKGCRKSLSTSLKWPRLIDVNMNLSEFQKDQRRRYHLEGKDYHDCKGDEDVDP